MKILYISSLILKKGSSASIRNTGLIKGLEETGNKIDILTVDYPEELEDIYLKRILENKIGNIEKTKLYMLGKYLDKSLKSKIKNISILKFIKKNIRDFLFFPDVDKEWIKNINIDKINISQYDVIITSSDTKTSHYIGKKIKNKYNKKWVQIWGDPWEEDIGIKGLKKIRARIEEKKILFDSDLILYVSPFTLEVMKNKLKTLSNKMEYLPRGYIEEVRTTLKDLNSDKNIIFTYTGILDKKRNILNFLEKIKEYNEKNKQKISFHFYGRIDSEIKEKIKEYKFIELKGIVSFEKIKEVYAYTDVLVYIDNGVKTTQIPGKIYDYLGTDKKIVALFNEKNEIYKYFENKLNILCFSKTTIKIEKILDQNLREPNFNFSNKNIAKELILKIKKIL